MSVPWFLPAHLRQHSISIVVDNALSPTESVTRRKQQAERRHQNQNLDKRALPLQLGGRRGRRRRSREQQQQQQQQQQRPSFDRWDSSSNLTLSCCPPSADTNTNDLLRAPQRQHSSDHQHAVLAMYTYPLVPQEQVQRVASIKACLLLGPPTGGNSPDSRPLRPKRLPEKASEEKKKKEWGPSPSSLSSREGLDQQHDHASSFFTLLPMSIEDMKAPQQQQEDCYSRTPPPSPMGDNASSSFEEDKGRHSVAADIGAVPLHFLLAQSNHANKA